MYINYVKFKWNITQPRYLLFNYISNWTKKKHKNFWTEYINIFLRFDVKNSLLKFYQAF